MFQNRGTTQHHTVSLLSLCQQRACLSTFNLFPAKPVLQPFLTSSTQTVCNESPCRCWEPCLRCVFPNSPFSLIQSKQCNEYYSDWPTPDIWCLVGGFFWRGEVKEKKISIDRAIFIVILLQDQKRKGLGVFTQMLTCYFCWSSLEVQEPLHSSPPPPGDFACPHLAAATWVYSVG